jgi:hypothetical protein
VVILPRRPVFDPRSAHFRFVLYKVAVEQVFIRVRRSPCQYFGPPVSTSVPLSVRRSPCQYFGPLVSTSVHLSVLRSPCLRRSPCQYFGPPVSTSVPLSIRRSPVSTSVTLSVSFHNFFIFIIHLHVSVSSTKGRILGTFQKAMLFRKLGKNWIEQ